MSSNVGLSTPRGSGTSGYVQRNLSALKPRSTGYGQPYPSSSSSSSSSFAPASRKPNQDILRHDRLRAIEVQVAELRERLEEAGKVDEEAIEVECERLRGELVREMDGLGGGGDDGGRRGNERDREKDGRKMKGYQVHEMAEAKERESERLRRALGLGRVREGEEGEHPMARQEKENRERAQNRDREQMHSERRKSSREREDERGDAREEQRSRRRRRRYSDD